MSATLPRTTVTVPEPGHAGDHRGSILLRLLRPRRAPGLLAGLVILAIAVALLSGGGFIATLVEDMLVYGIAAMALDFLAGFAGLMSISQAGFLGLGAYGVAIAEVHSFSAWEAVGISLGVVLAVGLATGIVAVRVSGISFAIITLALGQIFWGLAYQWVSLSEGDNGVPLTSLPKLGPVDLSDPFTLRISVLVVFIVVALVLQVFVHSPFGLSLRGLRSNETRMRSLGYRTGLHRYFAFVITAFFAGVAGILFVFVNRLMSPTSMDFSQDGILVLIVVLGGLGSIWGPAIGAVVVVLFQQELSIYFSRWETVMGLVFIAVVLFSPDGIWGFVRAAGRRRDAYLARAQRTQPASGPPSSAGPDAARSPGLAGAASATVVPSEPGRPLMDTPEAGDGSDRP